MNYVGMQACIIAPHISSSTASVTCLEKISGQELIIYQTRLLESIGVATTLICNNEDQQLQQLILQRHENKIHCVSLKYGQTLYNALQTLASATEYETILFFNGNMPCITTDLIEQLYTEHKKSHAVMSFVIAEHEDLVRARYNRVLKTEHNLATIMKASDYVHNKNQSYFIDAGIYLFDRVWLQQVLQETDFVEKHKEDLFFDLVKKATKNKKIVSTVLTLYKTVFKVDTVHDVITAESIKHVELVAYWMQHGVHFLSSQQVQIDVNVTIGAGSSIGAGVHLLNQTTIGLDCHIHAFTLLDQTIIGNNSTVFSHSVIKKSKIGAHVQIGPFAHVLENTIIGDHAVIGNFVEIKRSTLGSHTKAKHLSYLGDAHIGNNVNIGAGVITCNHDGFTKHTTVVEDHAYIGTNTTLIAPVIVEHNAFIAAGSVISKQVPSYALAIARSRQINKPGYVHILREKKQKVMAVQPQQEEHISGFIGAIKGESDNTPCDVV